MGKAVNNPFFENLSIRDKLRLIIILISGCLLLLAAVFFIFSNQIEFRREFVKTLGIQAELLEHQIRPTLRAGDSEGLQWHLNALKADRRIVLAYLFDKQGEFAAGYFRADVAGSDTLGLPRLADYFPDSRARPGNSGVLAIFKNNYLEIFQPVTDHGKYLGMLYLRADFRALWDRLAEMRNILFMILTAGLLLAYLLASRFQQLVTVPVFNLLKTMTVLAKVQDYSLRVEKTDHDELGQLVDGFNAMLVQIEKRDREVRAYREHLEEMVVQRTTELVESRDQAWAAHAELSRRSAELAEARDQAETASRAKSVFLASMSHELRTPLNGILGYAQLLSRDSALTPRQRNEVDIIYHSGEYLLALINDILDLSKIEAGKIELQPDKLDLADFLRGIVDMFQMRARQKGIEFHYHSAPDLPGGLFADEKRLRQILINLLANALKFTHQGEVRLEVGYRDNHLLVEVGDSGIGIAEEDREKIFLPFHQVGNPLQKAEGSGLGLAITRNLVDMMQGGLDMDSEPGQGSRFRVKLPLPTVDLGNADQSSVARPPARGYRFTEAARERRAFRLLVVDDREENRQVLSSLLSPLGFIVEEAAEGRVALEMIRRHPPDLVFIDIVMPGMDGLEVTRRVRHLANCRTLPIIAISASVFGQHRQESLKIGCNDFISKPVELDRLLGCLEKHLPLAWVHEAAPDSACPAPEIEAIPAIDPEKLKQLRELINLGNFTGIHAWLDKLAAHHPEFQAFVDRARSLARRFDDEGLLRLAMPDGEAGS